MVKEQDDAEQEKSDAPQENRENRDDFGGMIEARPDGIAEPGLQDIRFGVEDSGDVIDGSTDQTRPILMNICSSTVGRGTRFGHLLYLHRRPSGGRARSQTAPQ